MRVVYYPSDNEEGYIWESITDEDFPYFKKRGWTDSPADFEASPLVEESVDVIQSKKRGRPRKE